MKLRLLFLFAIAASSFAFIDTAAQNKQPARKEVIPHAQSVPPGPALSPQEAIKKMQVPPGFRVELVAAEPDIVNPVAMTFDEKGRIWITESIEYPRRSAGPGKDRVKLLESTKGDGKFDKIATVIEGLNIPSGIAVGHGGVWVANAPDILYYPFKDFATAKLAKPQVVVTGFGRYDTHELPNSLTWGPDGWLYGLNGVFNRSVVKQDGKTFDFTCALFKIHPKTKKFEIFCEGTSNPWGLAFNDNGDAFVSACVIDHLWHLTETGYYHRQGGPYPPFTWKIGSIVKHKHQKAAYCGLCWFDSDAYPPEYREKMYMGNIHGGCINADELTRDGSTYFAKPAFLPSPPGRGAGGEGAGQNPPGKPRIATPKAALGVGEGSNFLMANDAWFMPVAQKVGPDGCMYILDWYDRYHCYQDANRDPAGIDRLQGRLYRVVYKDYKAAEQSDLSKATDEKLIELLGHSNVHIRESAQRLLTERLHAAVDDELFNAVEAKLVAENTSPKQRHHLLWTAISSRRMYVQTINRMLTHPDAKQRAAVVRYLHGNNLVAIDREKFYGLAADASPDVQLQMAIAARKISGFFAVDPLPVLLDVLTHCGDDKLIPHIVWQNLHPLLEKDGERFLTMAAKADLTKAPGLAKLLPHAIDRILGNPSGNPTPVIGFVEKLVAKNKNDPTAVLCLAGLTTRIRNNEMPGLVGKDFRTYFKATLAKMSVDPASEIGIEATLLSAVLIDLDGMRGARGLLEDPKTAGRTRVRAMEVLLKVKDDMACLSMADKILKEKQGSIEFRGQIISTIASGWRMLTPVMLLKHYPTLEPELQPRMIEALTQNPDWGIILFNEIAAKKISKDVVNVNQARRLLATKNKELAKLVEKHWGIPRDSRNPEREKIAAQMKALYAKTPGDPKAGVPIFKKLCAQCHKMYGEGVDVGPDITSNGRADFDQLLSNIFDPSLVIGAGYQAVTVNTKQGQVISGLLVEDNDQRVVLKVQGGERKTIARADVEEQFTSKVSLMPEDLEKQLRPQEIVDLLAYLSLDRPPEDAKAKRIPGTPR